MCNIEERRRRKLQETLHDAALTLLGDTFAAGYCGPIPNTTPTLWVLIGSANDVKDFANNPPVKEGEK